VKNPYTQPLESFTFDEMAETLEAISSETGRLDFKEQMIPKNDLAYRACAFANADGGLIIIGIKDPDEGKPLEYGPPPATDDSERLRVTSSINSRVYPALPLDVMGYRSRDGTRALLVIRIGFSLAAPHEYTGTENHNLPVRRGATTERLRLAEIHILQLRHTGETPESPIWRKMQPHVNIMPMRDGYVGISFRPKTYIPGRRVMDATDDILVANVSEETRGRYDRFHGEMTGTALPDSVHLRSRWTKRRTDEVAATDYVPPDDETEIFSDGDIIIRHSQNDRDARWQFKETLLLGYTVAQEIYYHFALRPEVQVHVIARFDERRKNASMPLNDAYEDYFDIDLARDTFADAFLDTAMRLHRASNLSSTRDEMRNTLQTCSDSFPLGDELRPRWLTG
jgi:schlafen family protein